MKFIYRWTVMGTFGLLSSCDPSLPSYLFEQGFKQGALLLKAKPIDRLLKNPETGNLERQRLQLSQFVLTFAESRGLKTNGNYRKYIRLERPWVTQVVAASYADRLESYQFRFPVMGAFPYKGFFDEGEAMAFEEKLRSQGLDTFRRGVEAYSTAGWMQDPLMSTMIQDEARLIEVLIHELVHVTFYFKSHGDFNEAFATWFANRESLAFVEMHAHKLEHPIQTREKLLKNLAADLQLGTLIREIWAKGSALYAAQGRDARQEFFDYVLNKANTEPALGFLKKRPINNATITSLGTYYDWIPLIDSYANEHQLSAKEFLAKIVDQGSSIVSEIRPKHSNSK